MRRRLDLAMSLMGDPRLIFLDEPTTGLDPRGRRGMWEIIRNLAADGVTIFLTTQYLEEADQLADRVAVLDRGRLVAEGTPEELKRLIPGGHLSIRFGDEGALAWAERAFDTAWRPDDELILHIPTEGDVGSLRAVLDQLDDAAVDVRHLAIHTPDLDDVFLTLTGQPDTTPDESSETTMEAVR